MNTSQLKMATSMLLGLILMSGCGRNQAQLAPENERPATAAAAMPAEYDTAVYPFSLSPLPYPLDALEPHIDARTMEVHHQGHHKGYVDKLNAALKAHEDLQKIPLKSLITNITKLPEAVRTEVQNQGGGNYNHSMFWTLMSPNGGGEPTGALAEAINEKYGSFDAFKSAFSKAAEKAFGSGWVWLCVDKENKLTIIETPDQNNPLTGGLTPILGLDVWEHAYYLKYQNKKVDYIDAWWNVVNWPQVEALYAKAIR